ncbi:hypothetical protein C8A05DRAFT_16506 [Staphylotrichum tortipilum]|uniref:Uncharacterized protein n=1 Tax=Staphylotrichum tortipilum TaxID=2831512 RepID=A0AAN6RT91_9PEZI|nr:hypothetical protein C8A05DRAFT_16506 [Staphylotrichum longicolle]
MSPPYVIGDSSPFLKRVLIPFWIIRIIIMIVLIGLYAFLVAGLGVFKDDVQRLAAQYNTNLNYNAVLATSCIIMAIVFLCLILDIVCIVKRARRTLSPPFFLGVNITQSVFYTANFVLTMIGAHNGALSIAINVVILLSFLGLLIYAAVVFHQYRTGSLRGTYAKANDPEAHKLTGYPGAAAAPATGYPQQSYAQEYPRPGSYNPQGPQQYDGQGYEPYRQQQVGYAQ